MDKRENEAGGATNNTSRGMSARSRSSSNSSSSSSREERQCSDPIDRERFERMIPKSLHAIYPSKFREMSSRTVVQMHQGMTQYRLDTSPEGALQLVIAAHTLKGQALSFCCDPLFHVSKQLERAAKDGVPPEDCVPLCESVQRAYSAVLQVVDEWAANGPK